MTFDEIAGKQPELGRKPRRPSPERLAQLFDTREIRPEGLRSCGHLQEGRNVAWLSERGPFVMWPATSIWKA